MEHVIQWIVIGFFCLAVEAIQVVMVLHMKACHDLKGKFEEIIGYIPFVGMLFVIVKISDEEKKKLGR